jgi:aminomethyltransferase
MKRSALFDVHAKLSARMMEYQGWEVPAQFGDPSEEHHAVRTAAGLFDVSFLGRVELSGAGADALLQTVFSRSLEKFTEGAVRYGILCDEQGAIIDTVLLFRLSAGRNDRRYLLTTSPLAKAQVIEWLRQHSDHSVLIADRTLEMGQLALQGPRAEVILETLVGSGFKKLKDKRLREMTIAGAPVLVSRTGYTAERGYELFAPAAHLPALWDAALATGRDYGAQPCGALVREMLRVEAGYPKHGAEFGSGRTPLEAGLSMLLDGAGDFVGKAALASLKETGVAEKLVGYELLDKGIPRSGSTIFSESREIGVATSGCHSTHCRRDIGMGYVSTRYAQPGQEIEVEIKDLEVAARIVNLPFYRRK